MLITPRDISEFTFSYTANAEIVTINFANKMSGVKHVISYSLRSQTDFQHNDIAVNCQTLYSRFTNDQITYFYAKDIRMLTYRDRVKINSKSPIECATYLNGNLDLKCGEDVVNQIDVADLKNLDLFINDVQLKMAN